MGNGTARTAGEFCPGGTSGGRWQPKKTRVARAETAHSSASTINAAEDSSPTQPRALCVPSGTSKVKTPELARPAKCICYAQPGTGSSNCSSALRFTAALENAAEKPRVFPPLRGTGTAICQQHPRRRNALPRRTGAGLHRRRR